MPFLLVLSLWLAGAQTPARTPDIHFVATPPEVVDVMLSLARVTSQDIVYDLGSGDGRINIIAAQRFGARGVGLELDKKLVEEAANLARINGVGDLVRFRQADLFATNLSEATVVTLFLSPSVNLRLQAKLLRELKPGTRVVSYRFPIGDWAPQAEVEVEGPVAGTKVYFWVVPGR